MKLVAVQLNGEAKVYPPAPNWDQIWGTGPYWGLTRQDTHSPPEKPVSQEVIGTTPAMPVHVQTTSGIPWVTILATVTAAVVGALIAAERNHFLTRKRERDQDVRAVARIERAEYIEVMNNILEPFALITNKMDAYLERAKANDLVGVDRELSAISEPMEAWLAAGFSYRAVVGYEDNVIKSLDKCVSAVNAFGEAFSSYQGPGPFTPAVLAELKNQHAAFDLWLTTAVNQARDHVAAIKTRALGPD